MATSNGLVEIYNKKTIITRFENTGILCKIEVGYNFSDFGDLTQARGSLGGGSRNTRSIAIGGAAPSESNVMDFVTIASTGNASDFGDMVAAKGYFSAASDAHGGLQG